MEYSSSSASGWPGLSPKRPGHNKARVQRCGLDVRSRELLNLPFVTPTKRLWRCAVLVPPSLPIGHRTGPFSWRWVWYRAICLPCPWTRLPPTDTYVCAALNLGWRGRDHEHPLINVSFTWIFSVRSTQYAVRRAQFYTGTYHVNAPSRTPCQARQCLFLLPSRTTP